MFVPSCLVLLFRYAARFDCGCHYKISIKLLDKDKNVLDRYQFTDQKDPGRDWFQVCQIQTWGNQDVVIVI